MELGAKLKAVRKAHGVTQRALAEELCRTRDVIDVGFVSIRGISERETGSVQLTKDEFAELVAAVKRVRARTHGDTDVTDALS